MAVAVLAFFANLPNSPDFDIDEVFYAIAAQHISEFGSISWDSGPILVHPPLEFLLNAGWLHLVGNTHGSVPSIIDTLRNLNAILGVAIVGLVGVACRMWSTGVASSRRGQMLLLALALAATSPFLLRFGRVALIEPLAIAASLATVLLAYRMRRARTATYVAFVGAAIGLAVLTKAPSLFLVCAPLAASVLQRNWSGCRRNLGALAVGALVWSVFPLWAALQGSSDAFYDQQTVSISRLVGLLQVSGLNKLNGSPLAALVDTFEQYLGSYIVFGVGLLVLLWGLIVVMRRRSSATDEVAYLLGLGVMSYGFFGYSFLFGQANEQLSIYVVPASILLVVNSGRFLVRTHHGRGGVLVRMVTAAAVIAVALGAVAWFSAYWPSNDNATEQVSQYLARTMPACAPVNATGDPWHWRAAVRTAPITEYSSGPDAYAAGVRIFLLSDKDTEFRYGISNPELTDWVHKNGLMLIDVPSRTYRDISVWVVGTPESPPGASAPGCAALPVHVSRDASAGLFLWLLLVALTVTGAAGTLSALRRRGSRGIR